MTKTETIAAIARDHLHITTLERRGDDSHDFHDVSVWQLSAALSAAYEAGKAAVLTSSAK